MEDSLRKIQQQIANRAREMEQLRLAEIAAKSSQLPPDQRVELNVKFGEFERFRIGQSLEIYLTRIGFPIDFAEAEYVLNHGGCPQYPEATKGGSIRKSIAMYKDRVRILENMIWLTRWLSKAQLEQWKEEQAERRQRKPTQSPTQSRHKKN